MWLAQLVRPVPCSTRVNHSIGLSLNGTFSWEDDEWERSASQRCLNAYDDKAHTNDNPTAWLAQVTTWPEVRKVNKGRKVSITCLCNLLRPIECNR